MTMEIALDRTDWQLLAELQRDGRATYAELARAVAMSASAVAERIRRLEEAGVIAGYRAVVDPERVGLTVMAFVRLRYPTGNYRPFHALLDTTSEIVEAHHVTGEDCFVLKVLARSMRHLEEITGRIAGLGSVTTSVVYSSPLPRRSVVGSAVVASAAAASASRRRTRSEEGRVGKECRSRWAADRLKHRQIDHYHRS